MRARIIHDPVNGKYEVQAKDKWYSNWYRTYDYFYRTGANRSAMFTQEKVLEFANNEFDRIMSLGIIRDSKMESRKGNFG